MADYIMALDAGTTSNRCILFNKKGRDLQHGAAGISPVFSTTWLGGA